MKRFAVILGLLALSAGAFACGDDEGDLQCDLEPSGDITDGTFSGTFDFGGQASFPLTVTYTADSGALQGTLQFQDINESFKGTFDAQVDAVGDVTGTGQATGNSSGQTLQLTVSGVANDDAACGSWKNQVGQTGSWSVARTGG